ncbi:MAG TPA: hypothetical protein VL997_00880, partial [Dyella sp.]|nr:hypothetical protein [Dyella sp.]
TSLPRQSVSTYVSLGAESQVGTFRGAQIPRQGSAYDEADRAYVNSQIENVLHRCGYQTTRSGPASFPVIHATNPQTGRVFYVYPRVSSTASANIPASRIQTAAPNVLAVVTIDPNDRQTLGGLYFVPF